jgi:hypothetical protein
MSITLDWGDFDETFLVWNFAGKWSAEEFYQTIEQLKQLSMTKPYAVNIMVDMRLSLAAPNNLLTLLRVAVKSKVQNIGRIIVISKSNFWLQMYQMLVKTAQLPETTPVTFVGTVDDAYYKIGGLAATD